MAHDCHAMSAIDAHTIRSRNTDIISRSTGNPSATPARRGPALVVAIVGPQIELIVFRSPTSCASVEVSVEQLVFPSPASSGSIGISVELIVFLSQMSRELLLYVALLVSGRRP